MQHDDVTFDLFILIMSFEIVFQLFFLSQLDFIRCKRLTHGRNVG